PSSPRFPSTTLFRSKIAGRIARRGDTPFRRTFDYGVCCTCIARQRSSSTWPAAGDRSGGGRVDPARMVGRTECGVEVGRGRVVRGRCMTDRWTRAEEAFRQREAGRRYRRDDAAWERDDDESDELEESWADDRNGLSEPVGAEPPVGYAERGDYEDDYDTAVIPRYADDDPAYAEVARSRAERGARVTEPGYDDEVEAAAVPASRDKPAPRSRPAGRARRTERGAPSGRTGKAGAGTARSERTARSQQS